MIAVLILAVAAAAVTVWHGGQVHYQEPAWQPVKIGERRSRR